MKVQYGKRGIFVHFESAKRQFPAYNNSNLLCRPEFILYVYLCYISF